MSTTHKPMLAIFRSYRKMIDNSIGANLFRNLFFFIEGEEVDVLDDGDLSCAMFVSSILHQFGLVQEIHTTVSATIEDLKVSGWHEVTVPQEGSVILWGFKKKDDGTQGKHRHVGFYIDSETAISNSSDARVPQRHHPTYGTFPSGEARRDILAYYWHPKLDFKPQAE